MSGGNSVSKKRMKRLVAAADEYHANDQAYKKDSNFSFFLYIVLVVVIALSVRLFIFEPVRVDGDSMYDTLLNNERMFVEKVSIWFKPPQRGEIITCFYPGYTVSCVKRVIATEGETIEITNGVVYVNGVQLDESAYWEDGIFSDMEPVKVPENSVFVMGDNRNGSKDSRNYTVGPIPLERVVGRCRFVIWPLDAIRDI